MTEEVKEQPNAVPVDIHMLNGKTFVVDKVAAWQYVDNGVFATGHFEGYSGEINVLIPFDRIDYYELDFKRLEKYIAAHSENVIEGEAHDHE